MAEDERRTESDDTAHEHGKCHHCHKCHRCDDCDHCDECNGGDECGDDEVPDSKWLLMVYMAAAAPNLQQPLGLDLKELSRPLRDMKVDRSVVDVVVQVDTPTGISKRFRLDRHGVHKIKVFETKVTKTLRCFVEETVDPEHHEKKALVIWGHANGVGRGLDPTFPMLTAPVNPEIGAFRGADLLEPCGEQRPAAFVPPGPASSAGSVWSQLGELSDDHKLDLVGFDACFMASIEILTELRGNHQNEPRVAYVLAPQASIGLEGWHYDLLLDRIVARNGDQNPAELGLAVIDQVGLSRSSPEALSFFDIAHLDALVDLMKELIDYMGEFYFGRYREPGFRRLIEDALQDAAWARVRQFLDLADLCRLIASRVPDRPLRNAARAVLEALSTVTRPLIVDQQCAMEVPLGGLSIYCPWPRATCRLTTAGVRNVQVDRCEYGALRFSQRTGWACFMYYDEAVANAERRWVRLETRHSMNDLAMAFYDVRAGDPKPPGRAGDPKPPSRAGDPKPPGRDERKVFGRGDDARYTVPEDRFES